MAEAEKWRVKKIEIKLKGLFLEKYFSKAFLNINPPNYPFDLLK
jgi:hypothetical protein